MSNKVLDFFRKEEPGFNDVSDEKLTDFIRAEYPEFDQALDDAPDMSASNFGKPVVWEKSQKPYFRSKDNKNYSGSIVSLYGSKKGREAQDDLFRDENIDTVKEYDVRKERQDELLKF